MVSLHASQYHVLQTGFPTEAYGRTDGLIDHRFLQSRNFLLVLSVAFVDGMLLYGVNPFLPVEASAIFTPDPVKVNVYLGNVWDTKDVNQC